MKKERRCLIADSMHEGLVPLLQQIGWQADYQPEITREELLEKIARYQGLIIRSKTPVNAELIGKADKLEFVGRAGAGLDQLDVALLEKKKIAILNAPEGNRDALAEHTIGMLLCLFNKILQGDQQIRQGIWDREGNRGVELMNKTVALIGYGNMGQAFARRLKAFGCTILAYDKYLTDFKDDVVQEVSLQTVFEEADILSLHIPLTSESRGMIDDQFLEKFKKPIYLVNTARGEIAPYATLCNGLRSGKIIGAALDVLENEKITKLSAEQQNFFEELIAAPNVVLSPHVAGWTFESYERINRVLVDKIKRLNI